MQRIPEYSEEYKRQAKKVVLSISLFILIYLIVFLFSIIFIAALFIAAKIIHDYYGGILSLLSFFLLIIGLILLIFVFRFFFRKYIVDRSMWVEITEEEQPKLFELIKSIANEIDTNLPKRFYLSPDVDAFIFYDSNFWNLFYPSKENLVIGLGLVNSLNKSELKAILAHEFGHFTQSNLKRFSLVYIWNQIIYKMLIDEQGYQALIAKFNIGIFVWIVIEYANAVKFILKKAYEPVSIKYSTLSRELEYHADKISALFAGTVPNVTSLLRADLAYDTFDYIGGFYHNLISENIKTDNIYPQHHFAMVSRAKDHGIEIKNGLPLITGKILNQFNRSKLIVKDQWAWHPVKSDRIERFKELNIDSKISTELAWDYIDDKEEIQKIVTKKLFERWNYSKKPKIISLQEFQKRFSEESKNHRIDKKYNNFYLVKDISVFDIDKIDEKDKKLFFKRFDDIYIPINIELVLNYTGLDDDIKLLESIDRNEIKIDSYEYDSEKFHKGEAKELIEKLKEQKDEMFEEVNELDINIYKFFLNEAKLKGEESILNQKYKNYFKLLEENKQNEKTYWDLVDSLQFMEKMSSFENIEQNFHNLKNYEKVFREKLKNILNNTLYKPVIDAGKKNKIEKYLSKEWIYFKQPNYDDKAIAILEEIIYLFYSICSGAPFTAMKEILDYQITLIS